jgi:hypothetical protein
MVVFSWSLWEKSWNKVVEVGEWLSMSKDEIVASMEELKKLFDEKWIEENKNVHHFSYYIRHPELPGHILEMLLLGWSVYTLGGVEKIPSDKIGKLKDPKEWAYAYYEIGILAQVKKTIEKEGYNLLLPESEHMLNKEERKPDGLIIDPNGNEKFWVEVKYLEPIPMLLRKLNDFNKEVMKTVTANRSSMPMTTIVQIQIEKDIIEILREINEEVDWESLKSLLGEKFKETLEKIIVAIQKRELNHEEFSVKINGDVQRIEEGNTIRYIYEDKLYGDRLEVKVSKDRDIGPLIRGRVTTTMPSIIPLLISHVANIIRVKRKIEDAINQIPERRNLPMILIIGPEWPLGVNAEIVREAYQLVRRKDERASMIKEIWIHVPELKKYVHIPVIGHFNIIHITLLFACNS